MVVERFSGKTQERNCSIWISIVLAQEHHCLFINLHSYPIIFYSAGGFQYNDFKEAIAKAQETMEIVNLKR